MEVDLDCPKPFPNKVQKYKSTHNSAIFYATDFRFHMEVQIDCLTKWQSTKVQNRKVQKCKYAKNVKKKQCKKHKK